MASFKGYNQGNPHAIVEVIRHHMREIENPANTDIDPARSGENYSLAPYEGNPYEKYKAILESCFVLHRQDVNTLCEWIITAPRELPQGLERKFFENTYDFLNKRYAGEENVIYAVVHKDESGQPHLHYGFVPVTRDKNPNHETEFKVCKKAYINRKDLLHFHRDLQSHIDETFADESIIPQVQTGITAAQGGNRTVRELKNEREENYGYGISHRREREQTYDYSVKR